jgi:hypothetical protein
MWSITITAVAIHSQESLSSAVQLLIDMVLHQDLLLDHAHWVQQQQQECWQKHACVTTGEMDTRCAPHSCGAGVTESVRQAPAAAAPDAAAVGSRLGFGGTSSEECSYIERLLRTATAEQLERALTWGVEDWRMYWRVRQMQQPRSCSYAAPARSHAALVTVNPAYSCAPAVAGGTCTAAGATCGKPCCGYQ